MVGPAARSLSGSAGPFVLTATNTGNGYLVLTELTVRR